MVERRQSSMIYIYWIHVLILGFWDNRVWSTQLHLRSKSHSIEICQEHRESRYFYWLVCVVIVCINVQFGFVCVCN